MLFIIERTYGPGKTGNLFDGHIISRFLDENWQPCSTDIFPVNSFVYVLCGSLKDAVYPQNQSH